MLLIYKGEKQINMTPRDLWDNNFGFIRSWVNDKNGSNIPPVLRRIIDEVTRYGQTPVGALKIPSST